MVVVFLLKSPRDRGDVVEPKQSVREGQTLVELLKRTRSLHEPLSSEQNLAASRRILRAGTCVGKSGSATVCPLTGIARARGGSRAVGLIGLRSGEPWNRSAKG